MMLAATAMARGLGGWEEVALDVRTGIFFVAIFIIPFLTALLHVWRGKASPTRTPLIAFAVCIGGAVAYVWSIFDDLDYTAKPMAPLGVVIYSFSAGIAFVTGLVTALLARKLVALWRGRRPIRTHDAGTWPTAPVDVHSAR
jgi:prolipoprotein diacylglyceryltransferase